MLLDASLRSNPIAIMVASDDAGRPENYWDKVPDKIVRLMALTGRRVPAAFLERFGAIYSIVPPESLLQEAFSLANEIAKKSPAIARLMKESINLTESMPLNDGYRVEQLFTTLATDMAESKEAALAFVEKRAPNSG